MSSVHLQPAAPLPFPELSPLCSQAVKSALCHSRSGAAVFGIFSSAENLDPVLKTP